MCLICDRIQKIRAGTNPYFVAELEACYVVLGDFQFFRGYTLLLAKEHVAEIHQLMPSTRKRILEEMSLVAEAVFHAFKPRKLNYECLGNAEPHVHWHILPRHQGDPSPGTSSWKIPQEIRYDESFRPNSQQRLELRQMLLSELKKLSDVRIASHAPIESWL